MVKRVVIAPVPQHRGQKIAGIVTAPFSCGALAGS